jgi:hypothetical protein
MNDYATETFVDFDIELIFVIVFVAHQPEYSNTRVFVIIWATLSGKNKQTNKVWEGFIMT